MKIKIKMLSDANELQKESRLIVNQIGKTGTVAKRIQSYLVSEIAHIEEHRNPTRLNEFLANAKGGSVRVSAMRQFVLAFGNVEEGVEMKNGKPIATGLLTMKKTRSAGEAEEKLKKACDTYWLSFKPEKDTTATFDIEAAALSFLSKAYSAGVTDEQVIDAITAKAQDAHRRAKEAIARKEAKKTFDKEMAKAA